MTNYLKIPENSVFNTEKKTKSSVYLIPATGSSRLCVLVNCLRMRITPAYSCAKLDTPTSGCPFFWREIWEAIFLTGKRRYMLRAEGARRGVVTLA